MEKKSHPSSSTFHSELKNLSSPTFIKSWWSNSRKNSRRSCYSSPLGTSSRDGSRKIKLKRDLIAEPCLQSTKLFWTNSCCPERLSENEPEWDWTDPHLLKSLWRKPNSTSWKRELERSWMPTSDWLLETSPLNSLRNQPFTLLRRVNRNDCLFKIDLYRLLHILSFHQLI